MRSKLHRLRVAAALSVSLACNSGPFREAAVDLRAVAPDHEEAPAPVREDVLRVSVAAMESPQDTYADYSRLFAEVARRLGRRVDFVQRRTYREINELLASGGLDTALVCTGGYLELLRRAPRSVELVAIPVVKGSDTYQSLLVVAADNPAKSLADLAGRRFAFTEELSLTGRAWVLHVLAQMGRNPERFFSSSIFTGSHDRSIVAVDRGIADAAAVHSIVYEHQVTRSPSLAGRLRIVDRSPPFGMTPVVASTRLAPAAREALRRTLLGLAADAAGAGVLRPLEIDRFALPAPGLYESASRLLGGAP